ncbi:MAG: penicillin acylase family protein [Gemmatimonadota bacterium]
MTARTLVLLATLALPGVFGTLALPGLLGAQEAPSDASGSEAYSARVEIIRTEYGVPHILADDLGAMGYGLAWVMTEDYREEVLEALLRSNGRWGLAAGPEEMDGDFAGRLDHAFAEETYHLLPADVRAVYAGFAAGVNDYVRANPEALPDWARPEFTPHDVAARDIGVWDQGAVEDFLELREEAAAGSLEPIGAEAGAAREAMGPVDSPPSDSDLLHRWLQGGERAGEADPEVGSNAWALAPERTASGNAILLRNPHLSWTAGYYEAHVRVPGVLDFYGDFRVGGPFTTIGGFNRRLGWATTNNYPVLEEVYALVRDSLNPEAYLFDGGSVAIDRRPVTVEYRRDDGTIGRQTRDMPRTPLGPVIAEVPDTVYVVKAHGLTQYRVGEQWLRMMEASTFDEWTEAMKIRAKVSSNLTYADADGVIHLVWNAATPDLPHEPSDHPVLARTSEDVWTRLHRYDALPQLTNPPGGYVQNSNDPPYYTNLRQILPREAFPAHFPDPVLRFRSQNSLELIDTDDVLSLDDLMELKHDLGMVIADRMKDDLMRVLRERGGWDEDAEGAIQAMADWDDTASPDSRGSSLFELWVNQYMREVPDSLQFEVEWSEDEPMTTPRGVGDDEAAVGAFQDALEEADERWGTWDVTWGEVHRIRPDSGDIDLPVGGCASALGCFRVVGFQDDEDGKYAGYRGDGWVVAVEFADRPVARSVLLYGNSNRPDSPRYYDQAELFSEMRMKPVLFELEDVEAGAVERYRPGG